MLMAVLYHVTHKEIVKETKEEYEARIANYEAWIIEEMRVDKLPKPIRYEDIHNKRSEEYK